MHSDDFYLHLPDPQRQPAFYEGVAVKRGLAWVIDTLVTLAIALPVALFSVVGLFFVPLAYLLVGFFYRWWTISTGSATWGMRMMAIELRDRRGHRLDAGQAFLHTMGYTVSLSVPLVQLISIGFMLIQERGQGLTDMVLGTVMLNRRA